MFGSLFGGRIAGAIAAFAVAWCKPQYSASAGNEGEEMEEVRVTGFSNWWTLTLLVVVVLISRLSGSAQAKKPNIIFLMTDDVGWMDLGVYGGGTDRGAPTPNMDRLANEGMRFTDYYAQPTCTLGRLAVMTGREPVRSGILNVFIPGDPNVSAQRKSLCHST
jgi:hypothetical protein